jgi:di/tripeptidase
MAQSTPLDLDELIRLGAENLQGVVAIDSQSDERSESIPSTEGQRALSSYLRAFFEALGYEASQDAAANLLVEVPGEVPGPPVALMVHMDTARGTEAVQALCCHERWDGSPIAYPKNPRLEVSVERYPETRPFVGEDVLHGPGERAFGLDDKLGMSQLMTLGQVLARRGHRHGPLLFVFRPDEEIGRMAAVVGLAAELARRGVRYGYTIDGIAPFEVNVENFNASRAYVQVRGARAELEPLARTRLLHLRVDGAKSHGATAKAEGYKSATVLFARAFAPLSRRRDLLPLRFESDPSAEVSARLTFLVRGEDEAALKRAEAALLGRFEEELAPHAYKGALIEVTGREELAPGATFTDEVARLFVHLATFLRSEGPTPKLSEDSQGREGYTNPCFVHAGDGELRLEYRMRAFDESELTAREDEVRRVAASGPGELPIVVERQYGNMGPRLMASPELVTWATRAAERAGEAVLVQPIRGSTGVDPFLDESIPVANLGTGYFAPESEKEFTSKQSIARHVRWLLELVQEVASAPVGR